eukprot:UN27060
MKTKSMNDDEKMGFEFHYDCQSYLLSTECLRFLEYRNREKKNDPGFSWYCPAKQVKKYRKKFPENWTEYLIYRKCPEVCYKNWSTYPGMIVLTKSLSFPTTILWAMSQMKIEPDKDFCVHMVGVRPEAELEQGS